MSKPISREVTVSTEDVPDDPLRCPQCEGQNLVLIGTLQKDYQETWENGKKISSSAGEDLFHEVDVMECNDCGVRYYIITEEVAELMRLNQTFASKIAELTEGSNIC